MSDPESVIQEPLARVLVPGQYQRERPSTLNGFDPDPNHILFGDTSLNNPAEKQIYKDELKNSVFNALGIGLREGNLRSIYEEIHSSKLFDPNTSLYAEIQDRLHSLVQDPDNFRAVGQVLTYEERDQAIEALRFSRGILIEAAKKAGVFAPIEERIRLIQSNPNYERALQDMEELKDAVAGRDGFYRQETTLLNRASVDFGGMSVSYINSSINEMEYHLTLAEQQYFEQMADEATDTQIAEQFRQEAEGRRRVLESYKKDDLNLLSVAPSKSELTRAARVYLARKEKGKVPEVDLGTLGRVGQRPEGTSDEEWWNKVLEELRKSREAQEAAAEAARKQAELAEKQYELWKRGYSGVIDAVSNRTRVNPEQFDQQAPLWYEELSTDEKGMIRASLHINYLATIARDTGQTSTESWANIQGIRIERKDIKNMWEKMPGFRIAMATMSKDLFESGKDHFVLSESGYKILKDYDELRKYKGELSKNVAVVLRRDPGAALLATRYNLKDKRENGRVVDVYEQLAQMSVNNVDNLFFATGTYVSADEYRLYDGNDVKLASSDIAPDAIRTFFQPGRKAFEQMTEPRTGVDTEAAGRVERMPLGPLGTWVGWNIAHDEEFKTKFHNGELAYIPQRLYYSLLDQTDIRVEEDGERRTLSIAEMLVRDEDTKQLVKVKTRDVDGNEIETEVAGLYDFRGKEKYMDLGTVKADELWGDYSDERSAVISLYDHLVGDDPRKRLSPNKLINNLAKARKQRKLNPILNERTFVTAAVGMMISPEKGFVIGPDLILDIDQNLYQPIVNGFLSDERLFWGSPDGGRLRKELLMAYQSGDENNVLNVITDILMSGTFLSPRERRLWNIKKKKEEILREMGAA